MNDHASNLFLAAEWRHLVMANYAVDPEVVRPLAPAGTELDSWEGTVYASLVAFSFLQTRVKGFRIPFHQHFEEINLRFYVRRQAPDGWRRGVVFVKEIVPRHAIAYVARRLYHENYVTLPTRHTIETGKRLRVKYEWRCHGRWNRLEATAHGDPRPPATGSETQFISEHYWGYSAQPDGGTREYRVEHPPWNTWDPVTTTIDVDVATLYGERFVPDLTREPASVFVADGSEITVSAGTAISP